MRINRLGDNLYEVKIPWWKWSIKKELAFALKKIQNEGKVITEVTKFGYCYLVCTTEKA